MDTNILVLAQPGTQPAIPPHQHSILSVAIQLELTDMNSVILNSLLFQKLKPIILEIAPQAFTTGCFKLLFISPDSSNWWDSNVLLATSYQRHWESQNRCPHLPPHLGTQKMLCEVKKVLQQLTETAALKDSFMTIYLKVSKMFVLNDIGQALWHSTKPQTACSSNARK